MNAQLFVLSLCFLLGTSPVRLAAGMAQGVEDQEWRGRYHGDSETSAEVVTNTAQWNRLWRRLDQSAPPLDFTRCCAVVAFAGRRPTGGFTLEFLNAVPQGDDLLVRWRVRPPAPDAFVTQAFAQPWKVKVLMRPKGTVKVVRAEP
ncbi:protease complex subunit PrcB family protein [Geothrix fuzhouensis]|uniref:protease complex subunit PrcB family protein n=1 Tax=Geothrix fuzhouensis TaxID=2966451 RepID=UPI0021482AEF|nr:protease complex subunit PrcB family protein [Geothrix fuzhouensis]